MKENILLKVEGISKTFPGTKALKHVNLEIEKGEIRALVGENGAGKSTLSNVISGVLKPDEGGKIIFDGKEHIFSSVLESQMAGISFVHQETALIPALDVADNIFVGRVPKKGGIFIDRKTMHEEAQRILEGMGANIDASVLAKELNSAGAQMVEIAKALSFSCKLLILDEPTSALSLSDTQRLFSIIRELKSRGVSILYITHRMSEIFEICDSLTVMRDGETVDTVAVSDVTADDIVRMMVGRELGDYYPPKSQCITEEVVLKVEDLSFAPDFRDISFQLRKGEILGFAGLVGAGRSEIMNAITGVSRRSSGKIWLQGAEIQNATLHDATVNGFGFVNEDRKNAGLYLDMTIKENISTVNLRNIEKLKFFIDRKKENEQTETYIKLLNVKTWGGEQLVSTLSGGNQQKVMLAKWLATKPKVIILDEPTKGVDVGAKKEIHELLRRLADAGVGVMIVSSELPEIIGICDRVIAVYEHRIVGEISGEDINEQTIMQYVSGNTAITA